MDSPQSLGRYDLSVHLARGGMADVFEATDRMLDRRVAVKIMHQRFAESGTFVARFRKEALAAANLSHPNIVSIYDWGHKDGTYFIVMELVKGRSLRDVLRSEGKLLPRRAAEIAAEVASALEMAHRNGVVHRDIKPGNVLLAEDGAVKVTDFGVARARDDSQDLTRAGAVIGTATYFSPEQARGDPADERSDIYSLGVVLYEMLVGGPPFSGETPVSVAFQHVTSEVPPPGRLNPDIPRELEEIVMRSLEKDPARRYRTAADMRRDLLLFLRGRTNRPAAGTRPPGPATTREAGKPPPTVPPGEVYRRVQEPPRQPSQIPFVITSVVLAALVVVGVWYLLSNLRTEPPISPVTTEAAGLEIPDVVGQPEDQAFQALQEAGFNVRSVGEPDEAEPGTVIRTDPPAGTSAEAERFVEVVVSEGPLQIQVPTVVGSTRERARAQLTGQGFVVDIRTTRHETVGAGLVVSQAPEGTERAPRGSTVQLVVSAGPEPIEMPSVVGSSSERAEGMLAGLGLEVVTTTEFDAGVEEGFVIRQDPAAGTDINPGWTVQIVISEGPEEIEIEPVANRPVAEVLAMLQDMGLLATVVQESHTQVQAGLVIRTDPPPGTRVSVGSPVTVVESTGSPFVAIPDLTGLGADEAEAALSAVGLVMETAGIKAPVTDPELDGRVARQAPGPGSEALPGDTVLAVLGEYTPPVSEPAETEDQAGSDTG